MDLIKMGYSPRTTEKKDGQAYRKKDLNIQKNEKFTSVNESVSHTLSYTHLLTKNRKELGSEKLRCLQKSSEGCKQMGCHKKLRAGRKQKKAYQVFQKVEEYENQQTAEVGKAAGRWGQNNSLSDGLWAFFCCGAECPVRTEGLGVKKREMR